jgi:hypothetical protein
MDLKYQSGGTFLCISAAEKVDLFFIIMDQVYIAEELMPRRINYFKIILS